MKTSLNDILCCPDCRGSLEFDSYTGPDGGHIERMTCPSCGKNYENREYVNPGAPVATVLDLDDCWVKVYISSSQIGSIKIGQAADVFIDSFPGKIFMGAIKEVGTQTEFTPHNTLTQHERAAQVFAVKVKVDNSDGILKPGMPADVTIKLNRDGKESL